MFTLAPCVCLWLCALSPLLAAPSVAALGAPLPGSVVSSVSSLRALRSSGNSTLYTAETSPASAAYPDDPYLLHLRGDPRSVGYDYGVLAGSMAKQNYDSFLATLLGGIGNKVERDAVQFGLELVADWQWGYLRAYTPQKYLDELQGLREGGQAQGVEDLDKLAQRMITLANAPGDAQDIIFVLVDELLSRMDDAGAVPAALSVPEAPDALRALQRWARSEAGGAALGHSCSMVAAWGSRTADGRVLSSRNLDWNKDTGVAHRKAVTVYETTEEAPYATVGFFGMVGALAGMSASGVSVHEANLEETHISFRGFPWVLRLRHVMGTTDGSLDDAVGIFNATQSTVGFNHMVASAVEDRATVMETFAGYLAAFGDDDPRERRAVFSDNVTLAGAPLREAVWRTNHPYDPVALQNYQWTVARDAWSYKRYFYVAEALRAYEAAGVGMTPEQMINVTAIVAGKGQDYPYTCATPNNPGDNVISVVYAPAEGVMWPAWESGTAEQWMPAACNAYVQFDMNALQLTQLPWGVQRQQQQRRRAGVAAWPRKSAASGAGAVAAAA